MIEFHSENLTCEHVLLTRVTADFITVAGWQDGSPYDGRFEREGRERGEPRWRIRLSPAVAENFFKFNPVTRFRRPRLAAITRYAGSVVAAEIAPADAVPGQWRCLVERRRGNLERYFAGRKAWINGLEVFALDRRDDATVVGLGAPGWHIRQARGVRLDLLATTARQRFLAKLRMRGSRNASAARKSGDAGHDEVNEGDYMPVIHGQVMTYEPAEGVLALSPLLLRSSDANAARRAQKRATAERREGEEDDQLSGAYALFTKVNPAYVNINFALKAANTIGNLYGAEAAEFVDLPELIVQTGVVNLKGIDRAHRKLCPVHHLVGVDCAAWLLGLMYREKDIDRMRELCRLFRYLIQRGLVRERALRPNDSLSGLDETPEHRPFRSIAA